MRSRNLKKFIGISMLSAFALLGTATLASAQGGYYSVRQSREMQRRYQRQQLELARRQARQQERYRRQQQRAIRQNGYYNSGNVVVLSNQNAGRYRVYRNGSYYNTDSRGAELLRQAVNNGYQQGYQAGRIDRSNRRGIQWTRNDMYRSGAYGYSSYVDRSQYQYYFQQGFQKGYDDGYYTRNRYGTYSNGSASILSSILGTILNLRSY